MKKKSNAPEQEPVLVDQEIIKAAKTALEQERPKVTAACSICGGEATPNATETLCWVCRRLKISAWKDADSQIAMQE